MCVCACARASECVRVCDYSAHVMIMTDGPLLIT